MADTSRATDILPRVSSHGSAHRTTEHPSGQDVLFDLARSTFYRVRPAAQPAPPRRSGIREMALDRSARGELQQLEPVSIGVMHHLHRYPCSANSTGGRSI